MIPWKIARPVDPALQQLASKCLQAKVHLHRYRQGPTEHEPAMPSHGRHQIAETPSHPDIGDARAPDLVNSSNGQVFKQVWVDLVTLSGPTQPGLGVHCL